MGWAVMLGTFLGGWLFGGLTVLPVLAWALWACGTVAIAPKDQNEGDDETGTLLDPFSHKTEKEEPGVYQPDAVPDALKGQRNDSDVASGYFAVCREYVPGGINGKPPERITPAGAVIAMESPSVYQTMYRSLFDRNKMTSPSIDAVQGKSKKARNVFYVVLRLGHLMLYDDVEQLDVRHVVSLAHYTIDIYAGGEQIPEGELFIKRNCIRLTQRRSTSDLAVMKPFCFFSENSSEKEDFYHAMLQSQKSHAPDSQSIPLPLKFNTTDLVRLVQQLHASEENLHTRWINALVGRIFLAMYKTQDVERFIWTKITKKIARVPKPALINGIHVRSIDMGDLPPFITNPRLRDLSVDGDLTIEADISYKGNFRLEISAIARIELGSRFKAREVTLVLATILKRLDGHILIRVKPPPSNRLWMTFETAPKMELSIEPVVSSRQITYGVIIRAIESRIREVVSETLVLPNWDDIPFSNTLSQRIRGGIWKDQAMKGGFSDLDAAGMENDPEDDDPKTTLDGIGCAADEDATHSVPVSSLQNSPTFSKDTDSSIAADEDVGVSSATDHWSHTKPRNMRSGSFASAASPVVDAKPAVFKVNERGNKHDAASSMRTTISRSPPSSPASTFTRPVVPDLASHTNDMEPHEHNAEDAVGSDISVSTKNTSTKSLPIAVSDAAKVDRGIGQASPKNDRAPADRRSALNHSLVSATVAARNWINSRQALNVSSSEASEDHDQILRSDSHSSLLSPGPENTTHAGNESPSLKSTHSTPIGRGQPLPPPGTPLPLPMKPGKRNTWVPTTLATLTRRKPHTMKEQAPTPSPSRDRGDDRQSPAPQTQNAKPSDKERVTPLKRQTTPRKSSSTSSVTTSSQTDAKNTPPPLPKRRQRLSVTDKSSDDSAQEILVVAAPEQEGSVPTTPDGTIKSEMFSTISTTAEEGDQIVQDAQTQRNNTS